MSSVKRQRATGRLYHRWLPYRALGDGTWGWGYEFRSKTAAEGYVARQPFSQWRIVYVLPNEHPREAAERAGLRTAWSPRGERP